MKKRDWFKPKPKEKEEPSPWPFRIIIFFLLLFALNFALLIPQEIISLFYELELGVLQFLFMKVTFQVWFILSAAVMIAAFGYMFFPSIYVPSIGKRGKHFFYMRKWIEGDLLWFRLWSGYHLAVNYSIVSLLGSRITVFGKVEKQISGNIITLQTEDLEVDKSMILQRRIKTLQETLAVLEAEREGVIQISKKDAVSLMRRREENEKSS